MKTLKKVIISHKYVDLMPPYDEMLQDIIYISLPYKTAIHRCLCGCGEKTVTPLKEGYGWQLSVNHKDGKISLSPSIGNYNFECKSHYIITNSVANFV
ncbi:DUF6527 family protein [Mucilaginibacter sp.]|jgi:hypothetical protein|uniref:DUF6527 family protein n=1 Tax=Mucilaginibacter sp. TaxID=1882438 RepID=UPI003563D32D